MGRKAPRHRVHVIHWKPAEAREALASLRRRGFSTTCSAFDPSVLRRLTARPPAAVVIDLTRLPAAGRDVGVLLRRAAGTRSVPLVFAGGAPEKITRVRTVLPDAEFAQWPDVVRALRRTLGRTVSETVVPSSALAGYADTPLVRKLGIEPDMTVGLIDAPPDVQSLLGKLPRGVRLVRTWRRQPGLTLWFVRSGRTLDRRMGRVAAALGTGRIWIIWPKRASGIASDLTQARVREAGLSHGLVDFKIAAIDATWSGLKFVARRH
jgi:hypothetical protein